MANTKESVEWYIGKATTAKGYRQNLIANKDRATNNTVIGKMYCFYYDPKGKATLPIYDRFPLVFPIEPYNDGFLGLNLHYIDAGTRKQMLDRLMQYKTDNNLNENTKLKLSYQLIDSTKTLKQFRVAIKRYLYTHMRSHFVEIYSNEWNRVIDLPVQLFVRKP